MATTGDEGSPAGKTSVIPVVSPGGVQSTAPTIVYVRERASRLRRLLIGVGVLGLVSAIVLVLMATNLIPRPKWPFAQQVQVSTGPVLLESIQDLSQYTGARGNFAVPVQREVKASWVPRFVWGTTYTLIVVGSVDAYVDFSGIGEDAIQVSADGTSVEITLPPAQLAKPRVDMDKTVAVAVDKAFLTWLLGGDDAQELQNVYRDGEAKIIEAAEASELRQLCEANTRMMLENLVRGLGYDRVTVTYVSPPEL